MTAPDTPTQHPGDRDKHGTTDDRTIRYTQHGGTWTAKNPNGETDD